MFKILNIIFLPIIFKKIEYVSKTNSPIFELSPEVCFVSQLNWQSLFLWLFSALVVDMK